LTSWLAACFLLRRQAGRERDHDAPNQSKAELARSNHQSRLVEDSGRCAAGGGPSARGCPPPRRVRRTCRLEHDRGHCDGAIGSIDWQFQGLSIGERITWPDRAEQSRAESPGWWAFGTAKLSP